LFMKTIDVKTPSWSLTTKPFFPAG
jgi:hypothetical protein